MKKMAIGLILTVVLISSVLIGYSQNWFQKPTETPQPEVTSQPTSTPQSTATAEPSATATAQPTATPQATTPSTSEPTTTPQPTATLNPTSTPQLTSTPQSTATPQPTPTTQPTVTSLNLILEVYGNANLDDKVDTNDVTYVNRIIAGTANNTPFADANMDGKVDTNDVNQINAIITGQATQISMLDGNGKNITISLPVNRIVIEYIQNAELVRILRIENLVVGFDYAVDKLRSVYFPNNSTIVNVGNMNAPDYEAVLNLNPDVLLTFSNTPTAIAEKTSKLPGVDVVFLGLYYPNVTNPENSQFLQGILKAGYIFNRVPITTEYANWIVNITQTIGTKVNTLTENQKNTVLLYTYPYTPSSTIKAYATIDTLGQVCILSGGSNIAKSLPAYLNSSSCSVDAEWVLQQDPEYIFLHTVRYTFGAFTYADPAQGMDVDNITSISNCLQQFMSQSAFANLKAVKNGHVYIIAGDFRNNAMGGTLGAVYLSNILYPSLFSDLNAETIHQEYITRFLRLDYNLDNHGVFLYPALNVNGDLVGIPNGAS
jgi:iron complex transport system substrate-binding protein